MKIRQQHKTPNNMKLTDKYNVIREMADVINRYVVEKDLFSGGCCFSAYILAEYLKKLGINYKVVLFQYGESLNKRRFSTAMRAGWVGHVAIEVRYKNRKVLIGNCDGINFFFIINNFRFRCRTYSNISPLRLLREYESGDWNLCYDTVNNFSLLNDIKSVANKYIEKYMNA